MQTVEPRRHLAKLQAADSPVRAAFSPRDGAELCGLQVYDSDRWVELLYRGCDWSPVSGWPGRAPWLWPVAGRAFAEPGGAPVDRDRCSWRDGGVVREMPPHGFARLHPWRAIGSHDDESLSIFHARLDTVASEARRYPYGYSLDLITELAASGLTIRLDVEASRKNTSPMPFNLGLHLTFDLRRWWGPDWWEGSVRGLGRVAWSTDQLSQAAEPVPLPTAAVALSHPHLGNALIPGGLEPRVTLRSPDATKSISLAHRCACGFDADQALWVTHIDPARRFFCLEPWVGWPNAINSGRGVVRVPPGERWSWTLEVRISSPSEPSRPRCVELANTRPILSSS